jgi:hypothetical protein
MHLFLVDLKDDFHDNQTNQVLGYIMEKATPEVQERPTLLEAFKHSIILLLLTVGAVAVWYKYQSSIDPFFTEIVVGKIAAVLFFAVAGLSYFAQEKLYQKTSKWRRVVSWGFLLLTLLIALAPIEEGIRYIKNEKTEMLVINEGGKTYLKHSILGFSLLHPGEGFVLDANPKMQELKNEIEKKMMGQASAEIYPYTKQGEGALIILIIKYQEEVDQNRLSGEYQDILSTIERDKDTIDDKNLYWEEGKKEAILHTRAEDIYITTRLLPLGKNLIMLQAVTGKPKGLEEFAMSYKP